MMETFFSLNEQTTFFLTACVIGFLNGILFDVFRGLRKTFSHPFFLVLLEDFAFVIFFFSTLFAFSFENVRAELHFYVLFGAILGFLLYLSTLGFLISYLFFTLFSSVKFILKFIYKLFLKHLVDFVVNITKFIYIKFVHIARFFKKIIYIFKKDLKNRCVFVYNKINVNERNIDKKTEVDYNEENCRAKKIEIF